MNDRPRVLLVAPDPGCLGNRRHRIRLAKTLFPPLGILAVAAATPSDYDVAILDETNQPLRYEERVDLVALTASTASAPRAYEIAAGFRRRGVPVVMGGIHATALPEEALSYVDAVGVGEAEGFWPRMLADFARGKLEPIYRNDNYPSLDNLAFPRRDLLQRKDYFLWNTMQTTRGCPFRCSFCSVHKFFGGSYRMRPVPQVLEEARQFPSDRPLIFVDDNIFGNRARAQELMEGLLPMNRYWFSQASMDTLQDEQFLQLASRAGCRMLFVGLESLSDENLGDINKRFNHPDQIEETVQRLHRHGIAILGAFIVGLDHDDMTVFDGIIGLAEKAKLDAIQIAIRIPIPGTDDAEQLQSEGRIFDPDYTKRDGSHAVFRHPRISPPGLLEHGLQHAYAHLYSRRGIKVRMSGQSGLHVQWARKVNQGFRLRAIKWLQRLGVDGQL
ncbi:MAG: B12-binding domain-containing radical SAM protein [Armatimonadota bacterium]|nr:MAG: B12-binding domain-containing radical SAM protein [Armatimonadota bacterium]